jgi:ribosomal protein S3AE
MNLKKHIRKVLEEEISMRTSERDYANLIKKMVLDYVDFDICKLVVKKIDNTKNQYLIIMMVDQSLKTSYRE